MFFFSRTHIALSILRSGLWGGRAPSIEMKDLGGPLADQKATVDESERFDGLWVVAQGQPLGVRGFVGFANVKGFVGVEQDVRG